MRLLFLAHRIPYPPNKGDKIRAFHVLKHLARDHDVFLGTLIDDPAEIAYSEQLRPLCRDVFCAPTSRLSRRYRQLRASLSRVPLSVASFRHRGLKGWVKRILQSERPDAIYISSSAMFDCLRGEDLSGVRLIVDFVDVDSEKWRQYASLRQPPMSWIFAEESRRLLRFDRDLARIADACLFATEAEAKLFANLVPQARPKIHGIPNGVDADYFAPIKTVADAHSAPTLVFTGVMDYWPNVDAVSWLAQEVFPALRAKVPDVEFLIVGTRPTANVMALAKIAGIRVAGSVPDVRPFLAKADAVVAPLRVARGIQNKVLEGMAMARPVIATTEAIEGIAARHGEHVLIANGREAFLERILEVLQGAHPSIGARARSFVLANHSWDKNLRLLDTLLTLNADVQPSPQARESAPSGERVG